MVGKKGFSLLFFLLAICAGDRNYRRPMNCPEDFTVFDPDAVLNTVEAENQDVCANLCEETDGCEAYNYESKSTRTCELSEVRTDKWGLDMANGAGFAHLEKVEDGAPDTDTCVLSTTETQQEIVKFDLESESIFTRGTTQGFWCKDPVDELDRVYYGNGYSNVQQVTEYLTEAAAVANQAHKQHQVLDMNTDGAQHAVWDRKLYYKPYNRRQIMVHDFDTEKTHGYISDFEGYRNTYSGYGGQCHYDNGCRSDMDVATDESGVWVIWGREPDHCYTSISKIDEATLTISRTWHLSFDKNHFGNGFIAHGIFYGTNHYNAVNDHFIAAYNLRNDTYRPWYTATDSYLRIENKNGHMHYMNYNPKDKKLYTWEHTRQRRYHLTFRDVLN